MIGLQALQNFITLTFSGPDDRQATTPAPRCPQCGYTLDRPHALNCQRCGKAIPYAPGCKNCGRCRKR